MIPNPACIITRKRPDGWPLLRMRWENLLFLHWRWEKEDLQKRLPDGLTVDTHEGQAWLGVVPFFMRKVHPTGMPCLPWVSNFLELNVRTYVRDEKGRPGVWFFSLACNQPLAVRAARWSYGLNYVDARMNARMKNNILEYRSTRGGCETRLVYEPARAGDCATPGTLEDFLLERYVLFTRTRSGSLASGEVHHTPYQWRHANVEEWDFGAAEADTFHPPKRAPDHQAVALPVNVAAWPIRTG